MADWMKEELARGEAAREEQAQQDQRERHLRDVVKAKARAMLDQFTDSIDLEMQNYRTITAGDQSRQAQFTRNPVVG